MKLNRIAAGVIAGAVICSSTGMYHCAAMNYATAAETTEKEEVTAESYLAGGYDAKNATIYSDGSKTFNMNGRTYNQGVVFAGQYSYQSSTASISYNTEDISSISWVWGHLDNKSMTGATVSIYYDDVLMDKYTLSSDMLQQEYSVDVSEVTILKISVAFDRNAEFAMADVTVDDMKPATSPKIPAYKSVAGFTESSYNYVNYSTFSAVSDLEASRINGRYYYQGIIFSGQYSYQSSQAVANFNTENVKSISCLWGHIDNTSMTGATVSVYHDNVLTDKFALSATMPVTEYTVDVSATAELRFVVDFEKNAQFAMTDISVDANKTTKTGKAPTYKTPEMFADDGFNKINTSYFSAVSDLEAKKINGRNYYQGLLFSGAYSYQESTSVVDFNVENIDSISGTLGRIDNTPETGAVLSIYKDGVLTEKIDLKWNIITQDLTIDTKDCNYLRLSVEHEKNAEFALAEISINETAAKKIHTIPDYKDGKEFVTSAYDKYNASDFSFVSELDAYMVNGEKCYSGILFTGAYSYSSSVSAINFNVENINTVSWTWAHLDNSPQSGAKAKIVLDRDVVEEIELTPGMVPTMQVVDVSKVSKLRVYIEHEKNAEYVLKDIEISDEIVEVKIPLGDVDSDGSVNSADASLVLAEYAALSTNGTLTFDDKMKKAADVNKDGSIDSSDASSILAFYAYISTGGTETDMEKWLSAETE
ncbi:MAG: hypothetical protein IKV85_03550 [Ruminococcus sp.]|nr:hypothetical protein [Ruminococcus sp.]